MRNKFAKDGYIIEKLVDLSVCNTFDCNRNDLNDYFRKDIQIYKEEMFTQSYKLYKETEPHVILALLDFCNDSVRVEKFTQRPDISPRIPISIPYPAVKLTRFGVRTELQRKHIGTNALNLVKLFFITDNRTGCRVITIDAYKDVVGFYKKNGFSLFSDKDKDRDRRAMWFDLLPLKRTLANE